MLVPDTDEQGAGTLAQGLRDAVHARFEDGPVPLTVSIGLAESPAEDPLDATELFRRADVALYRAKEAGRDRVVAFEERSRAAA